jgi:quinol monooxygenase YgiN
MSIHLVAAFVGCIAAATGTGMLAFRLSRPPRLAVAFWMLALLGLAVALGAQALGYHNGFTARSFRAMELGAPVLAPLALCLGLAEVAGRTLAARFAARLILPALGLIAFVILGTDPLSGNRFSTAWPAATVYYQIIPNKLVQYGLAPVTAIVAFLAIGCTAMRPRQNPAWRAALAPVWAAGLAAFALALPGLSVPLGVRLPLGSLFLPLCLVATVLTWFAGIRVRRVRLDLIREGGYEEEDEEDWDQPASWEHRYDESEDPDLTGEREAWNGLFRREAPDAGYPDGSGYPAQARGYQGSAAGYPEQTGYAHQAGYADQAGYEATGPIDSGHSAAGWQAGSQRSRPDRFPRPADHDAREQLFGQIAIYTLNEQHVAEFDRLIERVVELVRSSEPNTLVFIVHAVPSAPMQRILYEVYRDRNAYAEHNARPYMARFEAQRAPLVLATNVIELGLQQAKVSPFPSIGDLFPEPGYDTSGFARPDYSSYSRPPAGPGGLPGSAR